VRVPELTAVDLVALAAHRRLTNFAGAARGIPAVIVELGSAADSVDAPLAVDSELALLPAVLIGVGRAQDAALVDVVAADLPAAYALVEHVDRTSSAATALALLLRHGAARNIAAGLVAESTTYSMLQGSAAFREWRQSRSQQPPSSDEEPPVRLEQHDHELHVVLHRPRRHNALSTAMSELLVEALTDALADPSMRVVLRGDGPSFCSGGDLGEFGSFPDPALAHAVRLSRSAGHLVHLLGDRVEVRVHGACIGAGIEVPAFAPRVVAHPDARIALPELALGLVPGAGGTVSIPRRIGRHRTMRLALTGETIDATTAREWGLVDDVTERAAPAG